MQASEFAREALKELPLVSVVIPTYQRREQAVTCVRRLALCDGSSAIEAIVVDQSQGQFEDIEGLGASLPFPLKCLQLERANVSAARNAGAKAAAAPFLIFIDDDIELKPDYIRAAHELLAMGKVDVVAGNFAPDFSEAPNEEEALEPAIWLPTGNIAMRTKDFLAVGGFDENVYRFNEDAELSHRLRLAGLSLARHSRLRAIHHHQARGGTWARKPVWDDVRSLLENDFYFCRAIGGGIGSFVVAAYRDLKALIGGRGKVQKRSPIPCLIAFCVALPSALIYSYRKPKLLTA